MARIFLTTLSLLLLLLAPSVAGQAYTPVSSYESQVPFLGRHEDSNTKLTGVSPEERKKFDDRTRYTIPQNAYHSPNKLIEGYYDKTCPDAEKMVATGFRQIVRLNPGAIGHIIRLQFHDCFVNGCDGSILLDFTPSGDMVEKSSMFNGLLLKGSDIIDDIKTRLEKKCPGIVSCADVLAFTTNEAMTMAGLPARRPLGGRRDSIVSLASIVEADNLPMSDWNIDQMMELFGRKGFNIEEMVVMIGAHSVGIAHCDFFMQRALNFNGTGIPDPTLGVEAIEEIRKACPDAGTALFRNPPVNFDATPTVLDNLFFKDMVEKRRSLLITDSHLLEDPRTRPIVEQMAGDPTLFPRRFAEVMIKLTSLNVLTGTEGEVRKICRSTN
ncbi:peroxidase [Vigna unguiculata]|uniref:Peroxidase n=1 Tax=Vigna unguiculata TaxID=3917 RepID=A0A4D6LQ02_VIGUN|nr:peroxidase [Vigna unguiculata]